MIIFFSSSQSKARDNIQNTSCISRPIPQCFRRIDCSLQPIIRFMLPESIACSSTKRTR